MYQPYPGPTPPYASDPNYYVNPTQPLSTGDVKDPYAGGRFKPKKKINDPIFLILFVLQVYLTPSSYSHLSLGRRLSTSVYSSSGLRPFLVSH